MEKGCPLSSSLGQPPGPGCRTVAALAKGERTRKGCPPPTRPRLGSASIHPYPALRSQPIEPILFPRLRIRLAEFPYATLFYAPETAHLGDLMRTRYGRTRAHPDKGATTAGFSRAVEGNSTTRRKTPRSSSPSCLAIRAMRTDQSVQTIKGGGKPPREIPAASPASSSSKGRPLHPRSGAGILTSFSFASGGLRPGG